MAKKILIPLIIGLLGILSLYFFINRQAIYSEYIQLREKNERLEAENKELTRRFSESEDERKRLLRRMEAIQKDLDDLSKERNEYKRKFEIVSEEKEELIERLKKAPVITPPSVVVKEAPLPREDVYWADVLKEKAKLELQLKDLQEEVLAFKDSLEKTNKEKTSLELEIKSLTNKILDLERQIKFNEQLASNLSYELVREKEDKRGLSEQIRLLREENTLFKRQLSQSEKQREELGIRLEKTESEKETLSKRLAEVEKIFQEKMTEFTEAKEEIKEIAAQAKEISSEETKQVELPPIIVRPQEGPLVSSPSVSGKIITVNREHNFVIIDLGKEHGINPGRTFDVFRDNTLIGKLEVIQTRASVSACDIKSKSVDLKVGDLVR